MIIKLATTTSLTSGRWAEHEGYKRQTSDAVEGSSVFRMINTDTYILMYDVYMKGKYQFCESTDLESFKVIDHEISMDFHPRHGSVIPITKKKELESLIDKWGKPESYPLLPNNPVLSCMPIPMFFIPIRLQAIIFILPAMDLTDGVAITLKHFLLIT